MLVLRKLRVLSFWRLCVESGAQIQMPLPAGGRQ